MLKDMKTLTMIYRRGGFFLDASLWNCIPNVKSGRSRTTDSDSLGDVGRNNRFFSDLGELGEDRLQSAEPFVPQLSFEILPR